MASTGKYLAMNGATGYNLRLSFHVFLNGRYCKSCSSDKSL